MPRQQKALKAVSERLETLEVEYVAIDDLRANSYNPNRQSEHSSTWSTTI